MTFTPATLNASVPWLTAASRLPLLDRHSVMAFAAGNDSFIHPPPLQASACLRNSVDRQQAND